MKWLLNKGKRVLNFILVDVFDVIFGLEVMAVLMIFSGVCIIIFELFMLLLGWGFDLNFYYGYYKDIMYYKHMLEDRNILIGFPAINYFLKRVTGIIVRRQTIG